MGRWRNWQADAAQFRKIAEEAKAQEGGTYRIYTVLDHVSPSGMTRWISAFIPVVRGGRAEFVCVAREKKLGGCGMDMGFALAYDMHCESFGYDTVYDEMRHSWL